MLQDYFMFHLNKARYELIEEGKRYYGETPSLKGVWAIGGTLEECRQNLLSAIEGWVIIRLQKNLPIPGFKPLIQRGIVAKQYQYV